jgi:hypothetical protein
MQSIVILSAGYAHIQGLYAVRHNTEYRYAGCRGASTFAQPIARRSLIKCILNVILNKLLHLIIVRLRG